MRNLKKQSIIFGFCFILFLTEEVKAQRFSQLDRNSHDIVYLRSDEMTLPQVKIVYGRPDAMDQKVFGTQIPYGKIWRTGSNEATEIKFYQNVMFGKKFIKAGTYVLYTIPHENYWTIILNKKTDTFGAFFYNPDDNVAELKVHTKRGEMIDNFSIGFKSKNNNSKLILAWARTRVQIPLTTKNVDDQEKSYRL